jgi:transcriptional regulator with XRE-family HTH domain
MARKQQIDLVGRRIRQLRKDRGFTQAELSHRISIQQSDLCRMESGAYKVSLETLFKILKVFEMRIAEFFHETTTENLSVEEQRLVNAYRTLTPSAKQQVREFVHFTDQRLRKVRRSVKQR